MNIPWIISIIMYAIAWVIAGICAITILNSIASLAHASGYNHEHETTVNVEVEAPHVTVINNPPALNLPPTFVQRTFESKSGKATSAALAGCDFGDAGRHTQVCVGYGNYEGVDGFATGFREHFDDFLLNGKISKAFDVPESEKDSNGVSVSIGGTWYIK